MNKPPSIQKVLSQTLAEKQAQALQNAEEIASQNIVGFFEQGAIHTADLLTNLEAAQWHLGNGYRSHLFPDFTEKFEGLESGFYIFAGESNSGYCGLF